jgi:hypothetical protein
MSTSISVDDLKGRIARLNSEFGGEGATDESPYCLDMAYSAYALGYEPESGGCRKVITYCTKKELYERMFCYLEGLREGVTIAGQRAQEAERKRNEKALRDAPTYFTDNRQRKVAI